MIDLLADNDLLWAQLMAIEQELRTRFYAHHDQRNAARKTNESLRARNAALERVADAVREEHPPRPEMTSGCPVCEALAALDAEGEKV